MTKEKWIEIDRAEVAKHFLGLSGFNGPESFPLWKKAALEYIKAMDEVTEVYNLENGVK